MNGRSMLELQETKTPQHMLNDLRGNFYNGSVSERSKLG